MHRLICSDADSSRPICSLFCSRLRIYLEVIIKTFSLLVPNSKKAHQFLLSTRNVVLKFIDLCYSGLVKQMIWTKLDDTPKWHSRSEGHGD